MKRLNIIGCGRVGQTLARQWHSHEVFQIESILTRSHASAQGAVAFIGAGHAAVDYDALSEADIYMIAAPDSAIAECASRLKVHRDAIVFHCSGAYPSSLLAATGAQTASLHPVKSFPAPLEEFADTWCGLEGDDAAVSVLTDALQKIGAHPVTISTADKTIYHAASVLASNYLTALAAAALDCLEKTGIDKGTGQKMLMPIIQGTVENIERLGPEAALTGPIARGDSALVAKQIEALKSWNTDIAAIYTALGLKATALSRAEDEKLEEIKRALA